MGIWQQGLTEGQSSSSVAAFLATDQSNGLGSYLKTCFAQRQSVLASPLLAWLLNFVELDLCTCKTCGVAVLAPSSLQHRYVVYCIFFGALFWNALNVECLVHVDFLVMSVDSPDKS